MRDETSHDIPFGLTACYLALSYRDSPSGPLRISWGTTHRRGLLRSDVAPLVVHGLASVTLREQ